ncbi:acyltransferase family protein [uncultured Polaribacter sp.]|uniref:acyltransferase family protein n=1 Tax=uncultured Polaribacter sp. TaxID=174711 RepID=UPI00260C8659|nr:acyltransferase family protein [uncultured Polaribacter sp.]
MLLKQKTTNNRINWLDQLKGFGILLMVYGHNFPVLEDYIYSFHMPLFFIVAGLFHPEKMDNAIIKKRAKQILIPYFLWSFFLFGFWLILGRKFGESALLDLSITENFIGIFFSQGDINYMNWGIPMWFLPTIFLTFLFFGFILKCKNKYLQHGVLVASIILGFLIANYYNLYLIWSLDVALVSLFFYSFGFYTTDFIISKKIKNKYALLILGVLHALVSIFLLQKIDMYRSIYSNEILFLVNSLVGFLFWASFFKNFTQLKFLAFLGKNTIPILALQARALSVIKLFFFLILGISIFNFTEFEKVILTFAQLIIMYPILIFINRYIPILNGKNK